MTHPSSVGEKSVSLCPSCYCMTKTVGYMCGKCGEPKPDKETVNFDGYLQAGEPTPPVEYTLTTSETVSDCCGAEISYYTKPPRFSVKYPRCSKCGNDCKPNPPTEPNDLQPTTPTINTTRQEPEKLINIEVKQQLTPTEPTVPKKSKEQIISETTKIIEEGRKIRSQYPLESIVRDLLEMVAETNPGFSQRCYGLMEILDSKEDYENQS